MVDFSHCGIADGCESRDFCEGQAICRYTGTHLSGPDARRPDPGIDDDAVERALNILAGIAFAEVKEWKSPPSASWWRTIMYAALSVAFPALTAETEHLRAEVKQAATALELSTAEAERLRTRVAELERAPLQRDPVPVYTREKDALLRMLGTAEADKPVSRDEAIGVLRAAFPEPPHD
jgi:hypothetical protein